MAAKQSAKFTLRLPPDLHEALQRAAEADARSVNAEILVLLREALARRLPPAPDHQRPLA